LTFQPSGVAVNAVEVALGLVEGELPALPEAHIFVGSGASWTRIHDHLPQFDAGRDGSDLSGTDTTQS
jgi:hypothetical protein